MLAVGSGVVMLQKQVLAAFLSVVMGLPASVRTNLDWVSSDVPSLLIIPFCTNF